MRLPEYHRNEDHGATALTVALVFMILLGIAALAIDASAGWNERRQDQTAVDIAAVAGALSFGSGSTNAIADEVMDAARDNLDTVYEDSEWDNLWLACSGPPPTGYVPASSSIGTIDCIGLNPSFVWVRLPDQLTETSFAKAIGFNVISTSAEAIVTLRPQGSSGALPFALSGDSGSGEVCLDTGTGTIEEPCVTNESGSFGNIAPPLFGSQELNTSPSCDHQSSSNNYVPESIAMGIDHELFEFTAAQWSSTGWDPDDNTSNNTVDSDPNTHLDECVDTGGDLAEPADGVPINTVYIDTGNSTKADVTEGLVTGTGFPDGGDARLTRWSDSSHARPVHGYQLDNRALWEYLGAESGGSDPEDGHGIALCDGPTIQGEADIDARNDMMRTCLEHYEDNYGASGPQIFSDDILETPRIGVAPRLWHNNLGSGITYRPIQSFDIVYTHGVWFKDGGSAVPFYPDDGNGAFTDGSMPVEQVTAYLLTSSMVSKNVHTGLGGLTDDTWQPTIFK